MATSKKFSELPVASSMNNGDLFAVAQEDAQAETGYTSKSATALVVGKKLNGEIEYATDLPSFPPGDQNPLDALEYLNSKINDLYPVDSASGSLVNFTTSLVLPLVALKTNIVASGGGGTPQDENPIIGFDTIKIGQTSGSADLAPFFKGLFQGTYGFVDLGALNWTYNSTYTIFRASLSGAISNTGVGNMPNIICPEFTTITSRGITGSTGWENYTGDDAMSLGYDTATLIVKDTSYTDADTFANAMSGVYLIYELATPTTPTITTEQFETLCQAFGITGNIFTIQLGQTVYGAYADKQSGKLVITNQILTIDGTETDASFSITLGTGHTRIEYRPFRENGKANESFISDKFESVSSAALYGIWNSTSPRMFLGLPDTVTTVAEAKTWFSNNNTTVVYPLATPIETDITLPDITALVGENNIFADTGNIDVSFKMGVQEYIDKKIAEVQALVL